MSGEILCLLRAGQHEYARESAGLRWCFDCRARLPHDDVLRGDPPGVDTYYEDQWYRECSRCGHDRTYFPGCGPL